MTSYRRANPGQEIVVGDDGRPYQIPLSADRALQLSHQLQGLGYLGQHPQEARAPDDVVNHPKFADFTKLPAWYTITILLDGDAGATGANGVQLRPEAFAPRRLTWATSGDCFPFLGDGDGAPNGGSVQGRAVTMAWRDEFTRFLGEQNALVSSLLGDSQGFLDFPKSLLLQGKQTITVELTRLFWPSSSDPAQTRWDFTLAGIALLPPGTQYSGGG